MDNLDRPLYTLTIREYIDLNKKILVESANSLVIKKEQNKELVHTTPDVIFIDEVSSLTGYKKATIYSKVCRFEIPVISKRRPLTFSRKAILQWLNDGKPSVIEQETTQFINRSP